MNTVKRVLITGCPRSGLSFLCQLLIDAGASIGESTGTRKDKSYLENDRIRKELDSLLYLRRKSRITRKDVISLKITFDKEVLESDSSVFVYKDPRLIYLYKIFDSLFHPEWVSVRRNEEDTSNSCLHTGFMRGYSTTEEWTNWVSNFNLKSDALESNVDFISTIRPTKVINGDFTEIIDLLVRLGLDTNIDFEKYKSNTLWRV